MIDEASLRSPIEQLAEQFLEGHRRGEQPSVAAFASAHPDLAEEILELFPAMLLLEAARPEPQVEHATRVAEPARPSSPRWGNSQCGDSRSDGPRSHGAGLSGAGRSGASPHTAAGPPLRQLGDYRLVRVIGQGGMGLVYEAVQESLGRTVAVKVLPPEGSNSECLRRFQREARAAARLHHTNIVPVFEVAECEGTHYYAMQFIHGRALDQLLVELVQRRGSESPSSGGVRPASSDPAPVDPLTAGLVDALCTGRFPAAVRPISAEPHSNEVGVPSCAVRADQVAAVDRNGADADDLAGSSEGSAVGSSSTTTGSGPSRAVGAKHYSIARIGLQVAEALAHAHAQRLLHRDIKPSNLLLDLQGTVWVTDFGLVRDEDELLTRAGDIVGTLRYLAPERLNGVSDERGDIYSLGLTLYELVAGQPAFGDADRRRLLKRIADEEPLALRKLDSRIPRDLETIIHRAAAKEPGRRYASAVALAEDLRRFLADRPIRARRAGMAERTWRWCRRNSALATALGLLLLSFFAGFAGVAWKWREAEAARQREQGAHRIAEQRAAEIQTGLENFRAASGLFERGRWYSSEQRWDDAYLAMHEAVALRPDFTAVWIERGELLARLGLFDLASQDFARAFAINPSDNATRWYWHALLRLYAGDAESYRQICQEMERRFANTLHPGMAADACHAALLSPIASSQVAKYEDLQARLVTNDPGNSNYAYLAGLIKLRQDDYPGAIHWLQHVERLTDAPVSRLALPPLAIAHARLGHREESLAMLALCDAFHQRWMAERVHSSDSVSRRTLGASTDWPIPWPDWLEFQLFYREAKSLIEGAAPREPAQVTLLRARAFSGLRWHVQAALEYGKAVWRAPLDLQVRWEAVRSWGYVAATVRCWWPAAKCFDYAHRLAPDNIDVAFLSGVCWFASGNLAAHREATEQLLQLAAMRPDFRSARNATTLFLLTDRAVEQPELAVQLARQIRAQYQDGDLHLAGVLYRAGHWGESLETYRLARPSSVRRGSDWALMGMAYARAGLAARAADCLQQAEQWVRAANSQGLGDPSDARPAWGGLDERIATPLLLAEARRLIAPAEPSAGQP